MKTTLSTTEAANILLSDPCANWSRAGAFALVEYLEQLEEDTGEEIEFDRVAIRCDFSEYDSLADWADEYFGVHSDWRVGKLGVPADAYDTKEEEAIIREYIQDHGQLIEFAGGIIVSSF